MKRQILLYGDSRSCADILYFTGVSIHDPFFAFTLDDDRCALLSPLEYGRAKRTSKLDTIFDYSAVAKENSDVFDYCSAAAFILKKNGVSSLLVPSKFPAFALDRLRAYKFDVKVCEAEIFPERAIKTKQEVAQIVKANSVASACFAIAEEILRESKIDGRKIVYRDVPLTSEYIRTEIERTAITLGADACETIVAGGNQACDPHEVGHGEIAPNSLIVMDIFPRLRESGYFGDMTRTFIKGLPTDSQYKLVNSVLKAQTIGLSMIRAGVSGSDVHSAVNSSFEGDGYFTEFKRGFWGGFFHSTGHGVGLDVHEAPSLGKRDVKLDVGNVVTVEPGLYYRGIGGCRIEDNVLVEKNGARLLSEYHYNWIVE